VKLGYLPEIRIPIKKSLSYCFPKRLLILNSVEQLQQLFLGMNTLPLPPRRLPDGCLPLSERELLSSSQEEDE